MTKWALVSDYSDAATPPQGPSRAASRNPPPVVYGWMAQLGMRQPTQRQSRRATWFRHGVHAIGCVVSTAPSDAYLCPLCLHFFTSEDLDAGVLTDEHVPPEAVGGKALVLTCESCNRSSGGLLDEFMANDEKLRTFGKPYASGRIPGSATVAGIPNNGSISFDGQTFVMHGEPGQNNPAMLAAHNESLERSGIGSSITLKVAIKRNRRRAAIGWMRSAYLAAFAVYGYRYVLQPAFESLRVAILDPDGTGYEPILLEGRGDGPLDSQILEVSDPASLRGCRAVAFGPRVILLPPWAAPADWFATLHERLVNVVPVDLKCISVIGQRFPEHPMYLTDG